MARLSLSRVFWVHLRTSVLYVTLSLRAQPVPRAVLACPWPQIPHPHPPPAHIGEPIHPLYLAFPIVNHYAAPVEIPDAPRDERSIPWMGRPIVVGGSLVGLLALLFTFAPDSVSAALNSYMSRLIRYVVDILVSWGYGPFIGFAGASALSPRSAASIMWVFSRLPSFVLVRFPTRYLILLPPRAIERLPNAAIEMLPVSTIEQLSPARISLLSPSTIARLPPATIARLPPAVTTTLRLTFGSQAYLRFLNFRRTVDGLGLSVAGFLPWIPVDIVLSVTRLVVSLATFSTPLIICMLVYKYFTR
ncbi:hypothetical protein ACLB2K_047036 [Fragaria x ananassa]